MEPERTPHDKPAKPQRVGRKCSVRRWRVEPSVEEIVAAHLATQPNVEPAAEFTPEPGTPSPAEWDTPEGERGLHPSATVDLGGSLFSPLWASQLLQLQEALDTPGHRSLGKRLLAWADLRREHPRGVPALRDILENVGVKSSRARQLGWMLQQLQAHRAVADYDLPLAHLRAVLGTSRPEEWARRATTSDPTEASGTTNRGPWPDEAGGSASVAATSSAVAPAARALPLAGAPLEEMPSAAAGQDDRPAKGSPDASPTEAPLWSLRRLQASIQADPEHPRSARSPRCAACEAPLRAVAAELEVRWRGTQTRRLCSLPCAVRYFQSWLEAAAEEPPGPNGR